MVIQMSNGEPKSYGVVIERSEDVTIGSIKTTNIDVALSTKNSKKVKIGEVRTFSDLPVDDFEKVKNDILREIEAILQEANSKKQSARSEKLIQFISAVGSSSLVELLKSYGVFPPQQ